MFIKVWRKLKNWLFPSCPWIAFLGVDGSGKSSVIQALTETLPPTGYAGLFVLHRRPRIVYRQATAVRQGKIEHYHKPPHSSWRSVLKLAAMWLDWLVGYVVYVHGRRARGFLVIADRHSLLDVQADPLRYRYGGSPRWARLAARFLPMPNVVLLLDAPTAVLQTRKQELTVEKMNELRQNYLNLVQTCGCGCVIAASQPLDQVVADVREVIEKARVLR
ncbi:MAG: hypothetical protein IPM39_14080 [Chloroflexi bacterium]|nr:hypothetical protein [Chloroflexota bacterium]